MNQRNGKPVTSDSLHDRFLQSLSETAAKMKTLADAESEAPSDASSDSALTEFHARTTELRYAEQSLVKEAAEKAYDENALLAIKLFFYVGDVRGGKGERDVFNSCMDFLTEKHPEIAKELLPLIPVYTRWDYLIRLVTSENEMISEEATRLVTEQFREDQKALAALENGEKAEVSLLAKWMPSLQTKKPGDKLTVRHLLKTLHIQERDYRHALSALREHLGVVEKKMSAKNYAGIDPEKMNARQQLRYSAFLRKVMEEKRHAYLQAVLRGEATPDDSVLNPLEICHEYEQGNWQGEFELNEDYEALWARMLDGKTKGGSTIVVRDGSDSMTRRFCDETSATMLEAANALAIYCAEKLSGAFKDQFITFSTHPQLVNLSDGKTLAERLTLMRKYDERSNIDVVATLDVLLDAATSGGIRTEDLPYYLLIISDMDFDMARGAGWNEEDSVPRQKIFETIRKKWVDAGYLVPTIVFWNLKGRHVAPEIDSENGVIYLNGFNGNELPLLMAGDFKHICENFSEETPKNEEPLLAKLSGERYDAVEEAVRPLVGTPEN